MSRPKLLIAETSDFSQNVLDRLKEFFKVDFRSINTDTLQAALQEYDIFWFRLGFQIDSNVLTETSNCKFLVTPVTGIDHIDENLCQSLGVQVICLRGETEFLREIRATAEMTIGLMITLMRKIPAATEAVKKGRWQRDLFRGNELYEKVVGIVGFGRLGKIVAEYCSCLGIKVLIYELDEKVIVPGSFTRLSSLKELVSKSDIVSLHVNYNLNNHHLISENILKRFKEGAFLINTSRGGLIDESALLKALDMEWIRGAALDVVQNEHNISLSNPLINWARENENLVIVPHIGGNTIESFEKTEHFIANKLIESFIDTSGTKYE